MLFGTSGQRESLPSLPSGTSSFTCFSPAAQQWHWSPGFLSLLRCRARVSAKLGMGALCGGAKRRASDKCQKEKSSGAGGCCHRAGLVKKQESVCGLVPDCSAVAWALGSILLGFRLGLFLWGVWLFWFFPLSISQFCGQGAGRCPYPLPGCVKVYHGSARFGNKSL